MGSGEVSYFKGESRFLISNEPCPVCNGSGFMADNDATTNLEEDNQKNISEDE